MTKPNPQPKTSASSETSSRPANPPATRPNREGDSEIEKDPAVERGERIQTGKIIARGGKSKGKVPGATESTSQDR